MSLNKDIYWPGNPMLNPPDLSGIISERTAMKAMILHSHNTAADMVLKEAGVANVRKFIAAIGLKKTTVPDSTRIFARFLFGAPNYLTITWDELIALPGPLAHPFLNGVETLASSPADLVSFFSRALEGKFSHIDRRSRSSEEFFPTTILIIWFASRSAYRPSARRAMQISPDRTPGRSPVALFPQAMGLLLLRAELGR